MAGDVYNLQIVISALDKASKVISKQQEQIDKYAAKTEAVRKGFTIAGGAMTAFGVAGALAIRKGIKAAADFEAQMANVNTMLSGQSEKLLPELSDAVSGMAAQYGEGTETLSKGLYDILSAGIDASESVNVLQASVLAAKAGLTDTGTAADALTTILNSYKLEAAAAGDVSDLLFTIVKKGKTTMGELAPKIGMVASLAASSGLSLEDMGAALATMTASGIKTDMAITSLKAITASFLKPQKSAVKMAKKYGIELNSNTLKTKGLTWILKKLSKATKEDTAAIFPNIRALTGVSAMLQDVEGYTEDYTAMLERSGSTAEAYEKQSKTLNNQIAILKESFAKIYRELSIYLVPIFLNVVKVLQNVMKAFGNLSPEIQKFIAYAALLTTGFSLIAGPMLLLVGQLPLIASGIVAIGGAAGVMGKAFLALATNPFILSLTVIAAGVALIADKMGDVNAATEEASAALDLQAAAQINVKDKMKIGFDIFKKYKDLEMAGIEDKRVAYMNLSLGIQGLYTAMANASDTKHKVKIQAEIDLLKAKRTELGLQKTAIKGLGTQMEITSGKMKTDFSTAAGEMTAAMEIETAKMKTDFSTATGAMVSTAKIDIGKIVDDYFDGMEAMADAMDPNDPNSLQYQYNEALAEMAADTEDMIDASKEGTIAKGWSDTIEALNGKTTEWGTFFSTMLNAPQNSLSSSFNYMLTNMGQGWGVLMDGLKLGFEGFKNIAIKALADLLASWAWTTFLRAVGLSIPGAPPGGPGAPPAERAKGGMSGGLTVVGEEGPELLRLPHGSEVFSNSQSLKMTNNSEWSDSEISTARKDIKYKVQNTLFSQFQNAVDEMFGAIWESQFGFPLPIDIPVYKITEETMKMYYKGAEEWVDKILESFPDWTTDLKPSAPGGEEPGTGGRWGADPWADFIGGIGDFIGGIGGMFATGGFPSEYGITGEQGAELVKFPMGSRVYSNFASQRMMDAGGVGGGPGISVLITGNTISNELDLEHIAERVSDDIIEKLRRERNI